MLQDKKLHFVGKTAALMDGGDHRFLLRFINNQLESHGAPPCVYTIAQKKPKMLKNPFNGHF